MNKFEQLIGYKFNNEIYLERALTHSSYNKEKNTKHQDNERLEFLGDAYFDAIVSAELFKMMKGVTEGKLTKTRALVVCESSLAKAARKLGLGKYIYIGHGEEVAGGRDKDSILADAMEAVIGAIFIDGGYEPTEKFVLKSFAETIKDAAEGKLFSDYKSEVQEFIQKNGRNLAITYNTVKEEGPAHDKTFFVNLTYDGKILGEGSGKSKKEAEQQAAKTALARLKRREIDVF
ncbi:MAG: ribonuclease III [Firmicutes bacterium]|nr:ribonuclease III [Bacillota bacterium]